MNSVVYELFLLVYSFASTKDELHDFAPDKEPLLSMLEGDVQPMYMCKPGKGLSLSLTQSFTLSPISLLSLSRTCTNTEHSMKVWAA